MSYFDDMEDRRMVTGGWPTCKWKWKPGRFHLLHPDESREPRYANEDARFAKRRTLCGVEVDLLDRIRSAKKVTCKACLRLMAARKSDNDAAIDDATTPP